MGDELLRELQANPEFKRRQRKTAPRMPGLPTSNSAAAKALGRRRMPPLPALPANNSGAGKALDGARMPPTQAPAPTAPGKTVILYEESADASEMHSMFGAVGSYDSHRARAVALSRVIPNSSSAKTSLAPVTIKTLTRLVFWGHGSPLDFCHFSPEAFAEHLAKWRALNPGLQRIDMPTCNVRHFDPQAVNFSQRRSFTDALKPELTRRGLDDLDIRTVPEAQTGPAGGMSKLQWNAATQSWAYLAAKGAHSDYHQMLGVAPSGEYTDLEQDLKWVKTAAGGLESYTGDLATRVQQMHAGGLVGAGTAKGGHIGDLMDLLEPI